MAGVSQVSCENSGGAFKEQSLSVPGDFVVLLRTCLGCSSAVQSQLLAPSNRSPGGSSCRTIPPWPRVVETGANRTTNRRQQSAHWYTRSVVGELGGVMSVVSAVPQKMHGGQGDGIVSELSTKTVHGGDSLQTAFRLKCSLNVHRNRLLSPALHFCEILDVPFQSTPVTKPVWCSKTVVGADGRLE